MQEFTASVKTANGATRAVTVKAQSKHAAISRLWSMGYPTVLWIL